MTAADVPAVGRMAGKLVRMHHALDPQRFIELRNPEEGYGRYLGGELSFEDYKVCIHDLVAGSDALGVDNIQSFRNAIHPWKSIQEPLKYADFDRARALHYVGSFKKIIEALHQWKP